MTEQMKAGCNLHAAAIGIINDMRAKKGKTLQDTGIAKGALRCVVNLAFTGRVVYQPHAHRLNTHDDLYAPINIAALYLVDRMIRALNLTEVLSGAASDVDAVSHTGLRPSHAHHSLLRRIDSLCHLFLKANQGEISAKRHAAGYARLLTYSFNVHSIPPVENGDGSEYSLSDSVIFEAPTAFRSVVDDRLILVDAKERGGDGSLIITVLDLSAEITGINKIEMNGKPCVKIDIKPVFTA